MKKNNLITERKGIKGTSYLVRIREKNIQHNQTFKSKEEAENFVREIKTKLYKGNNLSNLKNKKIKLKEIFEDYLKNGDVSEKKKYDLNILILEIGNITLNDFNSKLLNNFIKSKLNEDVREQEKKKKEHPLYNANKILIDGELVKRKYSEGTIRKYYYAIKTALKWHSKYYDYEFNEKPFKDNDAPRAWANPRTRIIEDNELNIILKECNKLKAKSNEFKLFIQFQYYSAMRCNESLLMKWDDIIINEKEPYKSYIIVPRKNQKTKNKESSKDRNIPLRKEFYYFVINELLNIKKENQNLVFGDYFANSGIVARKMKYITKKCNIENLKIHDLRHSATTWYFLNTNLSQIEISNITGHTELDTLKRYLNLKPTDIGFKLWN